MATEISVYPIDHAAPTPGLPLQPAAAAGSTRSWGWISATARSVGGACLRVLESPAAGTLIFTSVCLSMVWQQRKTRMPVPPVTRSMSMAMLQGGDKAMERFKLTHQASIDEAKLKAAIDYMRNELRKPNINFVKLYACVGVVEMSGILKEAIELLEGALKKLEEEKPKPAHDIHELELLLVELNIYQGDYKKALNYPCLKTDDVSSADARAPLYQAVIYTMMNKQEEAKKCFEMMREIRSGFHGQKFFKEGSSMLLDVADFNEFVKVVTQLRKEMPLPPSPPPQPQQQPPPQPPQPQPPQPPLPQHPQPQPQPQPQQPPQQPQPQPQQPQPQPQPPPPQPALPQPPQPQQPQPQPQPQQPQPQPQPQQPQPQPQQPQPQPQHPQPQPPPPKV